MNADSYNTWEDEENRTNSQKDRSSVEGEVEEILKERLNGGYIEVLVVWKGYVEPTWEPLSYMSSLPAYSAYVRNKV